MNDLQVKIILNCAFGIDLAGYEAPFRENGVDKNMKFGYILKRLLNEIPLRVCALRFLLFPFLINHWIFPKERELLHNIMTVRNFAKTLIANKRAAAAKDPSELDKGDLMSILISDEFFKDDVEMIVDECLTFFIAGT